MAYDQQQADLLRENVKLRATITESTIARIAGNIAAGLMDRVLVLLDGHIDDRQSDKIAKFSVSLARSIVAEVQRPVPAQPEP